MGCAVAFCGFGLPHGEATLEGAAKERWCTEGSSQNDNRTASILIASDTH